VRVGFGATQGRTKSDWARCVTVALYATAAAFAATAIAETIDADARLLNISVALAQPSFLGERAIKGSPRK
jgi:hypothetical protein